MALTRPRQTQLRDSDYKNSCRVVTVSNITLSGGTPATVDGVSLQVANRILVTAQTDASENGIYLVNTVGGGSNGTWQRSLDFNSNAVVTSGALVPITEGTSYANTLWRLTTADPITIDTTSLTFVNNILTDIVQDTTPQLGGNLDGQAYNITTTGTGTFGTMTDGTVSFSSGNITGVDTLRIDQSGTGLRMTNVGAFDNDGSDNFRIFATNDLQLKANGDSGGGLTIDATNQDVTITNDLRVSAGQFYYGGTAVTSTATELNLLDGVTGITLGSANELLVVGSDGTSIASDSTLAVDTANNRLGINQTSPEVTLHMTGESSQSAQIRMEQHDDSADAPDIRTRKSRGTAASSTKNNAGDYIFRGNFERYNGSAYTTVGQLAVDTNSSNADRFQLTLAVSEDGASIDAANAQFKIDGNDSGAITFNGAYKFPTADGSANQFLQTDGSGTVTFASATVSDISDLTATATELNLLDGVTGTLVTEAGTQTLTNKTLTSPTISNPTLTGTYTFTSDATTTSAMTLTASNLNDGVGALRINGAQADIYLNPSTATHTTVTFAVNGDQRLAFGMDNNSDFYITRRTGGSWYDDTFVIDRDTGLLSLGYGLSVAGNLTAGGNINTDPTATTVGTSATAVDTFSASTYRGAKYLVTVANSTNFDIIEALVVHNGTTATITVYGEVSTNTSLGDLTTDISSGNVRLLYTGGATGNSVKVFPTYIT